MVGLASGPVFATAGSWWRDERRIRRVSSLCLLGGVFVAEAGYLAVSHRPAGQVALMLVIGLLVPVLLGRSTADQLYGMAALVPAAAIGLGGYLVLNKLLDVAITRGA